jgi:tetratricopeptide (TPR) repeat protein
VVFEGLAAIEPREPYYHKALGAVALAVQEYETGLAHYENAVTLDGRDAEALLGRAEANLGCGRRREAEAALQRARKVGEDSPFGRRATAFHKALKTSKSRR